MSILTFLLLVSAVSYFIVFVARKIVDISQTDQSKAGYPCLTFEQFMSFYSICPEKFRLHNDHVEIELRDSPSIFFLGKDFYFKTEKDLKMYQEYHEAKRKQDLRESIDKDTTEATEKLIKMMRSEIDKKKKQAEKEITSSVLEQAEIFKRMMEDE